MCTRALIYRARGGDAESMSSDILLVPDVPLATSRSPIWCLLSGAAENDTAIIRTLANRVHEPWDRFEMSLAFNLYTFTFIHGYTTLAIKTGDTIKKSRRTRKSKLIFCFYVPHRTIGRRKFNAFTFDSLGTFVRVT